MAVLPAMQALLHRFLGRFITRGTLRVELPDGSHATYGVGTPEIAVRLSGAATCRRLVLDPTLAMGELYMQGALQPVGCTIYDFLDLVGLNLGGGIGAYPTNLAAVAIGRLRRRLDQYNSLHRARRNVAHHYDLDERLYALFLDRDRHYSCAYFPTPELTLEQAQQAKAAHIARKLLLDRPGLRVLDIGSGWGGLALTLARDHGCIVQGITLSAEQLAAATVRAEQAGLADRVSFRLQDYRALSGEYDRIVSVGMFEHVGVQHYRHFFTMLARCLAADGVALLHTIGRTDGPAATNRFIAKYIFPGGYAPALSEILPPIERAGLIVTDIEVLRLHYAATLHHWRARFAAARAAIADLYDERFCRMFEFYLALSEMSFRRLTHVNFQVQIARTAGAVPTTRDYMAVADGADRGW